MDEYSQIKYQILSYWIKKQYPNTAYKKYTWNIDTNKLKVER